VRPENVSFADASRLAASDRRRISRHHQIVTVATPTAGQGAIAVKPDRAGRRIRRAALRPDRCRCSTLQARGCIHRCIRISRAEVALKEVSKSFGAVEAVRGLSLAIATANSSCCSAPRCGKTTTLALIAGLERPDRGDIVIEGRVVTDAVRRTDVAFVFQQYRCIRI